MVTEQEQINNGILVGSEVALGLMDMHSPNVCSTSALLACMTDCIVQLSMRGWSKQELLKEVEDYYFIGQEILADMEAEECE
jgi:hypothetical protein